MNKMTLDLKNFTPKKIYFFIVLLSFIIYGNSLNNEYALDDNIVVEGNKIVEKGLKAIPEIFTSRYAKDSKQEYEYRPMVTLSFAIEKQFFGKLPSSQTIKEKQRKDKLTQANVSHFINLFVYIVSCIFLYKFLCLLFKNNSLILPLIVTLLFVVHPIHTEAVSNIKSRDELFVFLGIILALIWYIRFSETNQYKYLLFGALAVFFALYSKRNAIMIIGVAPAVLYYLRANYKKIGIVLLSLVVIFIASILIKRGLLSGKATRTFMFFENPLFFQGTFKDRILVGLYCSWFYLEMLFYPIKMSCYYGYNQIPMADLSYWRVWAAILFFIPMGIYGMFKLYKRDAIGIGIVLWFGIMLGVINVFFPIVGIVADRFSYAFSLGFCIVFAVILFKLFKIDIALANANSKLSGNFLITVLVILVLYSGRTIARNYDWHDYMTLYTTDIEHTQESAKTHALIANTLYPMVITEIKNNPSSPNIQKDINRLIYHFKEATRIDSTYSSSWNNLGSVYVNYVRDYNLAITYCKKAIVYNPVYLEAHYNIAFSYSQLNNIDSAYFYCIRTIEIDPDYVKIYDLLNSIVIKNKIVERGIDDLKRIADYTQKPKNVFVGLANLYSIDATDNYTKSIEYFEKAYYLDKSDNVLCQHLNKLYQSTGRQSQIIDCSQKK